MADPLQVASVAIETIGKLLVEEARFLSGVEGEVKLLQGELRLMQANLRDAEERGIESLVVQAWFSDVKDIAYDVEDLVERYAFRVGSLRNNGGFFKFRFGGCYYRHIVGLGIQPLNTRISILKQRFLDHGIEGKMEKEAGSSSIPQMLRRTYSFVGEEDFVGLHQDVDMLVEHLVSHSPYYRVVSITGMGGLGKTTIANKVYNHPTVKHHFSGSAWICVSQQWETNDILRGILIKLLPEKEDEIRTKWREDELLMRNLHQILQQKRCLIVLDDIWTTDAWNCIKSAFPTGNNGSKILVTTRNREVALYIGPDGFHHEPRLLDNDECWELLRRKSLPERFNEGHDGMNEFEILGKEMVTHCAGLPLAVIVLGGILFSKTTLGEWERVHQNIKSHIWKGRSLEKGEIKRILDLSYYELSYHLKPCFLYLGLFPEDTDIEVDTIYQLWMAEGLVLNDGVGEESIMELAQQYLVELGQRSMVQLRMSELPGMTRRIESCRLHDLMRELCLLEVKQDGFLTSIDQEKGIDPFSSLSASSSSSKHRRLVINLDDDGDLSNYIPLEKDITKNLRMFQFDVKSAWHDDDDDDDGQPISNMITSQLNKFEMLRVLRIKGFRKKANGKLPKAIGKLIHLRYLSLRHFAFTKLPSSLGNLRHLQTLDFNFSNVASFPNILWKMKGLTCLYLPRFKSKQCSIRLDGLNMLEILYGFDDDVCETKDLLELVNLRHLGAWCNNLDNLIMISNFVESNRRLEFVSIRTTCDFCTDREKGFTALKQLLFGRGVHYLWITGPMWKFPEYESGMASCLVRLRIKGSGLDIEDLCRTTQQFPHLTRLVIESAQGKELCFGANGFPKLEGLCVDLSELEKWIVEEGAMPNLRTLVLSCSALKGLPDGLCSVKNLKHLTIWESCSVELKEKIGAQDGEDFHKISHVPFVRIA